MAGNMSGFWGAILTYINWKTYMFIVLLLLYSLLYFIIIQRFDKDSSRIKLKCYMATLSLSVVLFTYDFVWGYGNRRDTYCQNQFQRAISMANGACPYSSLAEPSFVEKGTLLHYFPSYVIYQVVYTKNQNDRDNYVPDYTFRERQLIDSIVALNALNTDIVIKNNLILVLVESLESWVIDVVDEKGCPLVPVLADLVKNDNVLYVPKLKSQVKQGNSADGQMIANTGLLPISAGAACMIYGEGTYPGFAHLYTESIVVDACGSKGWNQSVMAERYGYQSITSANHKEEFKKDEETMRMAIEYFDSLSEPYCMQIITYSTHAPFTQVNAKGVSLAEDMPSNLYNYMQSVHYADSCIGLLLKKTISAIPSQNTTLIITGDHTIFKKQLLEEFNSFVRNHNNYPIPSYESYCPLIICSPTIKNRVEINDLCYQMDIFPTILHCIGADDYYWKGFGVNLLDSVARNNRKITEEEAYILSDKMIRSDWFRHNTNNTHKQ
ncbi:MAG: sulfatase-like hydrolase/transferase [Bacteroidales bacterium]|nr:sulfatase-like hydrolase/transferase [Bacteroidales bacterium]